MTNNSYICIISFWLFLLVVYLGIVSDASEEIRKILAETRRLPKTKGTIKTIECPEDGVVIDCIDYWQQPAFNNPITRKMQLLDPTIRNPTEFGMRNESKRARRYHKWNKYGKCPKDTIPIRRTRKNNDTMNHSKYPKRGVNDVIVHEYAVAAAPRGTYYGMSAALNIWQPYVVSTQGRNDMSLAQMWLVVSDRPGNVLDTIEAGWQVYPSTYGTLKPRIFIYWSNDNYRRGCYNMEENCPGFVADSEHVTFDCDLYDLSDYEGEQLEYHFKILMSSRGQWYLFIDGDVIGYWPANLFTSISSNGATNAEWGGEIGYQTWVGEPLIHTDTQMGSGHFPNEGFNRAAYVSNMQVTENTHDDWHDIDTNQIEITVTIPTCYDLLMGPPNTISGSFFLFGGPGGAGCND